MIAQGVASVDELQGLAGLLDAQVRLHAAAIQNMQAGSRRAVERDPGRFLLGSAWRPPGSSGIVGGQRKENTIVFAPQRRSRSRCAAATRRGLVLASALLAVVPLADLLRTIIATPPVIVVGATLSVVGFLALVLRLGCHEDGPRLFFLAAFLWGAAVAPFLSLRVNDALLVRVPAVTPVFLAPAVEELAKAAALAVLLLLRPDGRRRVRSGVVYGALIGLGFTMAENLSYLTLAAVQGGLDGLDRAIWVRGILGGSKHAVFTATTGAALGWACQLRTRGGRIGLAVAGIVAAVLQHGIWNAVASHAITDVLCNAALPGSPCRPVPDPVDLFLWIPLIALACLGPGVVVLAVIVRRVED